MLRGAPGTQCMFAGIGLFRRAIIRGKRMGLRGGIHQR